MSYEELRKSIAEVVAMQKETAKQMQEMERIKQENALQIEESDRKFLEMTAKWDCGVSDDIGYHAEQFFQNILAETLTFAGEKYDIMIPNLECKGKNIEGEFDIVLVNGKSVAIIEAKSRIHQKFVRELVGVKAAKFRRFFPKYKALKLYLGIAGFSFSKKVLEEAKKYGVGIIRQVGKSIEIEAKNLKAY